jgi:hypothetical protein
MRLLDALGVRQLMHGPRAGVGRGGLLDQALDLEDPPHGRRHGRASGRALPLVLIVPILERAVQEDLIITPGDEPGITVDNLEVAQFIYLLHNEKIRDVIDTITSKVVPILGGFTEERKVVLDALREELRRRDYTPVLFDFDKPASKDLTATVQTLANMARFIIADVTDPSPGCRSSPARRAPRPRPRSRR